MVSTLLGGAPPERSAGTTSGSSVPSHKPCETVLTQGIEEVRGWKAAPPTRSGSKADWIHAEPLAVAREVAARLPALHRARHPLGRHRGAHDRRLLHDPVHRAISPGHVRVRPRRAPLELACLYYSSGALGTDRYPPFTLDEAPDYPATLDIAYPERLSRGLVLVKWWLLAIPQYILLGIFLGGAGSAADRAKHSGSHWWYGGGLIWALVLFAAIALLFTARYPRGLFDFVLGLDRWVARVIAYAGLMTDAYPPFRLDQGGDDPAGAAAVTAEAPTAPEAIAASSETAGAAVPVVAQPAATSPPRGGAGRVVLIVVGVIAALVSLGLLAGGTALVVVDQTQRDDDGFLMSPSEDFSTATYAIVSDRADVDFGGSSAPREPSSARSASAARAIATSSSGSPGTPTSITT